MAIQKKLFSLILSMSILLSVASCSKKLSDETVPATTASVPVETVVETEPVTETTEAAPTPTEIVVGPNSTAVVTDRAVDKYGKLYVEGTHLMSSVTGEPVQLRGMSTYGLYMCTNFFNVDTIQTLTEDWGCQVIRIAMYTEGTSDGYIKNPEKYYNQACQITDMCIDAGVYVIMDWHILADGDPNMYKAEAIDFFQRYTAIYGEYDNIIYEVCNEPNGDCICNPGDKVNWDNCIKPYNEELIDVIRAKDPDNVIICGTSTWSHDVDIASMNPIEGEENIMYTFHFYAGSSGQESRDRVQAAMDNGLPIFCTEWGTTYDSGNGGPCIEESNAWMDFFYDNQISWCNWSIGGAAAESSNALLYMSNFLTIEEKLAGHWPDVFISPSGLYARAQILRELSPDFEGYYN